MLSYHSVQPLSVSQLAQLSNVLFSCVQQSLILRVHFTTSWKEHELLEISHEHVTPSSFFYLFLQNLNDTEGHQKYSLKYLSCLHFIPSAVSSIMALSCKTSQQNQKYDNISENVFYLFFVVFSDVTQMFWYLVFCRCEVCFVVFWKYCNFFGFAVL